MIAVVVVAGGTGERMGSTQPKQFLPLDRIPIISRTLQAFDRSGIIDTTIVVMHHQAIGYFQSVILPTAGLQAACTVVPGGPRRQDSVFNGLEALGDHSGTVLIHDAVRPLVSVDLIRAVAEGARKWGACIPAVPAVETLKQVGPDSVVTGTLRRNAYQLAQTPQAFDLDLIRRAHGEAIANGVAATDDASLVEAMGGTVHVIEGDRVNIKITTPEDIAAAEAHLKTR